MKLCAAAVLLAMAWAAPAAGAAEVKKRDRAGDARVAALDIASVTARADTAGLAVDVRLRGDFERLAARGDAVARLDLRRKRGRAGILFSRGPDRRARVRSERVRRRPRRRRPRRPHDPLPRGGRCLRCDPHPRARRGGRAADEAALKLDHRSAARDAACRDLVRARSDLALRLGRVGRALARGPQRAAARACGGSAPASRTSCSRSAASSRSAAPGWRRSPPTRPTPRPTRRRSRASPSTRRAPATRPARR